MAVFKTQWNVGWKVKQKHSMPMTINSPFDAHITNKPMVTAPNDRVFTVAAVQIDFQYLMAKGVKQDTQSVVYVPAGDARLMITYCLMPVELSKTEQYEMANDPEHKVPYIYVGELDPDFPMFEVCEAGSGGHNESLDITISSRGLTDPSNPANNHVIKPDTRNLNPESN